MAARIPSRQKGFSLLELVIAMVLTALLAVMAMQPVLRALQARATVADNLAAVDALRYATERIVRELRQARYNAQGTGFQLAAIMLGHPGIQPVKQIIVEQNPLMHGMQLIGR